MNLKKLCERGQHCSCFVDGIKIFKWVIWYWGDCCKEHDLDYIYQRTKTKLIADNKMYKCIRKKAPRWIARLMYKALRKNRKAQGYWDTYKENINK